MLDMDSTEIPVYGQKQHSAQNGRLDTLSPSQEVKTEIPLKTNT
jgi:hypothetical protein